VGVVGVGEPVGAFGDVAEPFAEGVLVAEAAVPRAVLAVDVTGQTGRDHRKDAEHRRTSSWCLSPATGRARRGRGRPRGRRMFIGGTLSTYRSRYVTIRTAAWQRPRPGRPALAAGLLSVGSA